MNQFKIKTVECGRIIDQFKNNACLKTLLCFQTGIDTARRSNSAAKIKFIRSQAATESVAYSLVLYAVCRFV